MPWRSYQPQLPRANTDAVVKATWVIGAIRLGLVTQRALAGADVTFDRQGRSETFGLHGLPSDKTFLLQTHLVTHHQIDR